MNNIKDLIPLTKQFTLLYVEDDQDVQTQTYAMLKILFKEVECADDGLDALEKYRQKPYDIVLTDLKMPKMGGIEMSKVIRNINRHQIIVILSAHSDSELFLDTISLGVDGFILKPIDANSFFPVMEKVARTIYLSKENEDYNNRLETLVKKKTAQIIEESQKDQLTGLYNHLSLMQALKEKKSRSLLLLNIDQFGLINDVYGFDMGDEVLKSVSNSFIEMALPKSKIFRLSADEFVILMEENLTAAVSCAKKILTYFSKNSVEVDELSMNISFSIGLDSSDNSDILKHAKIALLDSREDGRNSFKIFTDDTKYLSTQKNNLKWIKKLQLAFKNDEVHSFYQPIVNNKNQLIEKYECLVRIVSDKDIYVPYHFLGAAKLSGMLSTITKRMIEKSFQSFKNHDAELSLNITDEDLKNSDMRKFLLSQVRAYNVEPSKVVLEILENIVSLDEDTVINELLSLKKLGFKIAIDDFGAEGSNFARLLKIDPDYLKIDGAFIKNIATDTKSMLIVETIVTFCQKAGIKTIAEYVHNKETQEIVNAL